MRAKDVLLEAIAAFSGTVVFVSHDRYFIDRLATRVLEVEDGTVTSHEGNYEDYLRRKQVLAAGTSARRPEPSRGSEPSRSGNGEAAPSTQPAPNTIVIEGGYISPNGSAPREKNRRLNPIKQKQMEDRCGFLEEEIPRIEAAIAHTEQQLAAYVSTAETARLTALAEDLRNQLTTLTAEWEELMLQLEGA
jgi:ATP-binding cassette subfamily F protein 3